MSRSRSIHVSGNPGDPDRRDRLCLVIALATVPLILLGRAGEQLGLDRTLRANTVRSRTHSLFRQGREYLRGAFGRASEDVERLLAATFLQLLAAQRSASASAGFI